MFTLCPPHSGCHIEMSFKLKSVENDAAFVSTHKTTPRRRYLCCINISGLLKENKKKGKMLELQLSVNNIRVCLFNVIDPSPLVHEKEL